MGNAFRISTYLLENVLAEIVTPRSPNDTHVIHDDVSYDVLVETYVLVVRFMNAEMHA